VVRDAERIERALPRAVAILDGEGLPSADVNCFLEDSKGLLWAGTATGLAFREGNGFRSPAASPAALHEQILGLAEDKSGSLWMATSRHVLRVNRDKLLGGALAEGDIREFGFADGLRGVEGVRRHRSVITDSLGRTWFSLTRGISVVDPARLTDGRIWVATVKGIAYFDPRRIPGNPVPTPVRVESVKVNGKEIVPAEGLVLSHSSNDLEIDYTALSLTNPERVRFKYKLEGQDSDWKDVGGRRQAYYGGLAPKNYRFRVIAANESGVWNEAATSFDFSIDPAYYQTRWFQASCVATFLVLLWALHRFRLHQIAQGFNARMEERVAERTRLARDLHDTLLQGFQGLMLRLQALDDLLPAGEAKDELERTLDRGDQVAAEGRKAVHDLRLSAVVTNDLARAVRALGEELSSEDSATFGFMVEGHARELHPIVRDEVYRITREALRNAFNHARAHHIEAEIIYTENLFRLRIRDDGEGVAPAMLEEGRPGHYGLPGMRERASEIGARLDIWSGVGAGTEVDLSVPGSIAYGKRPGRSRLRVFREKAE
jgi:signal transduction histidine kinase